MTVTLTSLPGSSAANLREIIRQFTPNWFTATMGTGILALALNQFPVPIAALHFVGEALWWMNMGLFGLFTLLYGARWVIFPYEARRIFGHSVMSMFFGAIPMGLATIINGFLSFGIPHWGATAVVIGLRGLVAAARYTDDAAIPARRDALQYRLVGLHLSPRRIFRRDPHLGAPDALGISAGHRRLSSPVARDILGGGVRPHSARRLAAHAIRLPLPAVRFHSKRLRGRRGITPGYQPQHPSHQPAR